MRRRRAWICHAKPAALGGKTCGHVNANGGVIAGSLRLLCCEGCGCTRAASDDRARRAQRARGAA